MRDVCAEVIEDYSANTELFYVFQICWINLLGTYKHPEPFAMGSGSHLAVEVLIIPKNHFLESWEVLNDT